MDGRAKRALVASAATAIMLPGLSGTAWAHDTPPADTHDHTYDTSDNHDHTYDTWDNHQVDYHVDETDQAPPATNPAACDDAVDIFDPYTGTCVEPNTEVSAEEPAAPPHEHPVVDHSHDHVHYHDHVADWVYVVLHSHEDPGTTTPADPSYEPHGTYVAYQGDAAPSESYHCGFPAWWFEFH